MHGMHTTAYPYIRLLQLLQIICARETQIGASVVSHIDYAWVLGLRRNIQLKKCLL